MTQPTLIDGPTDWIKRNGRARRVEVNSRGLERQHFLLRAEAVDLSEGEIARLTEDEAYAIFEGHRFAEKGGVPFCPHCGTENAYRLTINRRTKTGPAPTKLYRCRNTDINDDGRRVCGKQFSVTSGTIFNSRKMSIRDILYAEIVFANAASGEAALRMRRAIRCSYKTAFVLQGKFREAIHASRDKRLLHGVVEVDGTTVGGHARKAPMKLNGREQVGGPPSPKKHLVGLRERRPDGQSRMAVFDHESQYRDAEADTDFVRDNVVRGSRFVSDEGFELGYWGDHKRVKHKAGYKIDGVHSNGIEGLFSRFKRAENGVHYGLSSQNRYLALYGAETCWREDYRRRSNGEQWRMLTAAITPHLPKTGEVRPDGSPLFEKSAWRGYWQRWCDPDAPVHRRHSPDQRARRARRGARAVAAWEAEAPLSG